MKLVTDLKYFGGLLLSVFVLCILVISLHYSTRMQIIIVQEKLDDIASQNTLINDTINDMYGFIGHNYQTTDDILDNLKSNTDLVNEPELSCAEMNDVTIGDVYLKMVNQTDFYSQFGTIETYCIDNNKCFDYIMMEAIEYSRVGDCVTSINQLGSNWYTSFEIARLYAEDAVSNAEKWCDFIGCD